MFGGIMDGGRAAASSFATGRTAGRSALGSTGESRRRFVSLFLSLVMVSALLAMAPLGAGTSLSGEDRPASVGLADESADIGFENLTVDLDEDGENIYVVSLIDGDDVDDVDRIHFDFLDASNETAGAPGNLIEFNATETEGEHDDELVVDDIADFSVVFDSFPGGHIDDVAHLMVTFHDDSGSELGSEYFEDLEALEPDSPPAATVTVATQPGNATAGVPIEGPPTVNVSDGEDRPLSQASVTVVANESGVLAGTTTVETDAEGVATFEDVWIEDAGTYTLAFEVDELPGNATSDAFAVTPGPIGNVTVEPGGELEVNVTESVAFSATATDEFGNLVAGEDGSFEWDAGDATIDENGTFEATTRATYNVTATLEGVTSPATTVTVTSPCHQLGDVAGNGAVTSLDATLTLRYVAGDDPTGFEPACADLTNEGNVTAADVTYLQQIVVGLESPPEE